MSKIALSGNASGTGTLTIAAPDTSTDRTLTLPDNSGTLLTSASNLAGVTGVGKVLQVVQGSSSTEVINNSSSFVDTGLTATITPSSTSSKVLVQAVVPFALGTNGGSARLQFRILRDATAITSNIAYNNVQYIVQLGGTQVIAWLDAPSSTSALTYKIQFKELTMTNRYGNTTAIPTLTEAQTGVIQVMEIAA